MRVRFYNHVASALCTALLLAPGSTAVAAGLKGKVKKGVYSSPGKLFSLPVPDNPMMEIADSYGKDGSGMVDFFNPFGARNGIRSVSFEP